MKSLQTTIGGIIILLGTLFSQIGFLFDGIATTNPDWGIIAAGVGAFWVGWKARDNNVSSETAGAK